MRLLGEQNMLKWIERLLEKAATRKGKFNARMNQQTERIDKTVTSLMLKAERICKRKARHKAWSPQLIRRFLTLKYWRVKLEGIRNARDPTTILQHIRGKYPEIDDDPEDNSLDKGNCPKHTNHQSREKTVMGTNIGTMKIPVSEPPNLDKKTDIFSFIKPKTQCSRTTVLGSITLTFAIL